MVDIWEYSSNPMSTFLARSAILFLIGTQSIFIPTMPNKPIPFCRYVSTMECNYLLFLRIDFSSGQYHLNHDEFNRIRLQAVMCCCLKYFLSNYYV